MTKLEQRAKSLKKANAAMAAAINHAFPIGTKVVCKWGRGYMHGTVSSETPGYVQTEYVRVRSIKGHFHSFHFRDVQYG
jgi:hypothetical protein